MSLVRVDMSGKMTDKLAPRALIIDDFKLTKKEIERLEAISGIQFSEDQIIGLSTAFGKYVSGTIIFSHSSSPKTVGEVLRKIKTPLNNLLELFDKFWGVDGANALIVKSLGVSPSEIPSHAGEIEKLFGVKYTPSDVETGNDDDLYLVTGHVIDQQLSLLTEDPFDIAYLYEVFRIALESIETAEKENGNSTGRIGDPHFTAFLIDVLNVICPAFGKGPYDSKTIDFIDDSRQIVAERLGALGEKMAQQTVKQLDKKNLVSRIRDARKEDAKSDHRASLKRAPE